MNHKTKSQSKPRTNGISDPFSKAPKATLQSASEAIAFGNGKNAFGAPLQCTTKALCRILLQNMNEGAVVFDEGGEIGFCNVAFAEMIGRPITELEGANITERLAGPYSKEFALFVKLCAVGPCRKEFAIVRATDNSQIPVEFSSSMVTDGNDRRIVSVVSDIANRKKFEVALRESEARFRQFAQASFEGLLVHSDGVILDANERLGELLGYNVQDNIGKPIAEFIDEKDRELVLKNFREGCAESYEIDLIHKTGSRISVEVMARPVVWRGRRSRVVAIRDITDIKRQTAALAAANKDLESFSYSVAHDLRTPLQTIRSFTNFLVNDHSKDLDKNGKDYLEYIKNAGQQMDSLINDILNLSRITRQELELRDIDISALANEIIEDLKRRFPDRNIEVVVESNLRVLADANLLRLALGNLIENAWKYSSTTQGSCLTVGSTDQDGRKAYYVRDNGVGFDMKWSRMLFEPFKRFHSDREFPGTGVGLAIVERVVLRHEGKVWAESKPGKGATFYFTVGK